jgi:hypothetical protein
MEISSFQRMGTHLSKKLLKLVGNMRRKRAKTSLLKIRKLKISDKAETSKRASTTRSRNVETPRKPTHHSSLQLTTTR